MSSPQAEEEAPKGKGGRKAKSEKQKLAELMSEVSTMKSILTAKLMLAFPDSINNKSHDVVEKVVGSELPNTILEYSRTDSKGVVIAPGMSMKQRGYVGDDGAQDPEAPVKARSFLKKALKKGAEPRFDGPVSHPGKSKRLKEASSKKFYMNAERSSVEVHTLPIELAIEQEKRTVEHIVKVVDPAINENRATIIKMQGEIEILKAQNAALIQVVNKLVDHSERTENLQNVLLAITKVVPDPDILGDWKEGDPLEVDIPEAVNLVAYGNALRNQPRAEIEASEPLPQISIAEQVPFQGALDTKNQLNAQKVTKYWEYASDTFQALGTRASRKKARSLRAAPAASAVPIGSPAQQSEQAYLEGANSEDLRQTQRGILEEASGALGTPISKKKRRKTKETLSLDPEPLTPMSFTPVNPLLVSMSPSSKGDQLEGTFSDWDAEGFQQMLDDPTTYYGESSPLLFSGLFQEDPLDELFG